MAQVAEEPARWDAAHARAARRRRQRALHGERDNENEKDLQDRQRPRG
jgi:hypothetical protein